ncbi:hypothetical protein KIPB_002241 [Kipferlia bialata]|uniref:EXS domain-containing protein n=1 Tax=Kipferlia bialata TaxID=797122 RepID=A0A391NJB7_9EUKA|nr:hypothetical protein KIPB_002241 [Kipferlia bialata]|eukprot:g2241.t1
MSALSNIPAELHSQCVDPSSFEPLLKGLIKARRGSHAPISTEFINLRDRFVSEMAQEIDKCIRFAGEQCVSAQARFDEICTTLPLSLEDVASDRCVELRVLLSEFHRGVSIIHDFGVINQQIVGTLARSFDVDVGVSVGDGTLEGDGSMRAWCDERLKGFDSLGVTVEHLEHSLIAATADLFLPGLTGHARVEKTRHFLSSHYQQRSEHHTARSATSAGLLSGLLMGLILGLVISIHSSVSMFWSLKDVLDTEDDVMGDIQLTSPLQDAALQSFGLLAVYRVYVFLNMLAWDKGQLSWRFIFGIQPSKVLLPLEMLLVACIHGFVLACVVYCTASVNLLSFSRQDPAVEQLVIDMTPWFTQMLGYILPLNAAHVPVALQNEWLAGDQLVGIVAVGYAVYWLWPARRMFAAAASRGDSPSRRYKLFVRRSLLRCLCAPFPEVLFPDFFIADVWTSMGGVGADLVRLFSSVPAVLGLGTGFTVGNEVFAVWSSCVMGQLPNVIRLLQCYRRLRDDRIGARLARAKRKAETPALRIRRPRDRMYQPVQDVPVPPPLPPTSAEHAYPSMFASTPVPEGMFWPHGYNLMKYLLGVPPAVLFALHDDVSLGPGWLHSDTVWWAAMGLKFLDYSYRLFWDLRQDWVLFKDIGHLQALTRRGLVLGVQRASGRQRQYPAYVYWCAVVYNTVGRYLWILQHVWEWGVVGEWLFALAEATRRGVWSVFRVEAEHLENCGRFRALKIMPYSHTLKLD